MVGLWSPVTFAEHQPQREPGDNRDPAGYREPGRDLRATHRKTSLRLPVGRCCSGDINFILREQNLLRKKGFCSRFPAL